MKRINKVDKKEIKKEINDVIKKAKIKEEVKEEVKTTPKQERILWKNNGGTFRLNKKIIKPGEKFRAYPYEISKAFRDVIIALEPIIEVGNKEQEIITNVPRVTYTLQPNAKEKGFFDIYNTKGKKMNEKPLEEEIAKQLVKDLQS